MICRLFDRRGALAPLLAAVGAAGTLLLAVPPAPAQDEPAEASADESAGTELPNVASGTLGGLQFWGDELRLHDWRIQRHVYTGHCRLLDGQNQRLAWGSFDQCHRQLRQIRREQRVPDLKPRVVFVLHGLGRTEFSMHGLCRFLREQGDWTVMPLSYPSTRAPMAYHAGLLARVIDHLDPEVKEISFVAHSMGNIVIRHYLADCLNGQGAGPDARIRRLVMLGPPNHGSLKAQQWNDSSLFRLVFSAPGRELGDGWQQLEPKLAVPRCEFGILAGGTSDARGYSRALPGDDDGTVTVETTRLSGARDFRVVSVRHTFLMDHPEVQKFTARFLEHGYFESDAARQPLEVNAQPPLRRTEQ